MELGREAIGHEAVVVVEKEVAVKVRSEAAAEVAFDRAEDALAAGGKLTGTGFWPAVDFLRRDPAAASNLGARAAAIDLRAFESGVKLRLPAGIGILGLTLTTAFGVIAIWFSARSTGWTRDFSFLVGFGALEIGTHTLTHWLVGKAVGIRFTHVFIGGPPPPRPGAKIDYESYLLVPPMRRAVMHASGAVVTKILPFALVPVASLVGVGSWVLWVLLIVGFGQIATDLFLSTKTSDWKRVKRERAAAKARRGGP